MISKSRKTTPEKVGIFRELFTGLTHTYGTYDPGSGRARQVKEPVTDEVLLAHLTGRRPYGVYLLVKDRTHAIAVDFDTDDTLPPAEFVNSARHYELAAYIERSKSKGHHVWIFFEESGVAAIKARRVVYHILDEIGAPYAEVFPKQDALDESVPYGNFINAPLFGRLVPRQKTVFVDPLHFEPYQDQWDFLESVGRLPESALDDVIELNDISLTVPCSPPDCNKIQGNGKSFGLPPCAQTMVRDGVAKHQRVSCFRLAVHLKRLGLPYDMAVAALKTWALKNKPMDGKRIITEPEILSQASYAYEHSYSGYGCKDPAVRPFCEPSCPVIQWRNNQDNKIHENVG